MRHLPLPFALILPLTLAASACDSDWTTETCATDSITPITPIGPLVYHRTLPFEECVRNFGCTVWSLHRADDRTQLLIYDQAGNLAGNVLGRLPPEVVEELDLLVEAVFTGQPVLGSYNPECLTWPGFPTQLYLTNGAYTFGFHYSGGCAWSSLEEINAIYYKAMNTMRTCNSTFLEIESCTLPSEG